MISTVASTMAWPAIFLTLLSGFLSSSLALIDHCTVTSDSSQTGNSHAAANSLCTTGSVWWNLPRGILQVTFDPVGMQDFSLCVRSAMGPSCPHIFAITSKGPVDITTPNQETEMCAKSFQGRVVIQFDAPVIVPYMVLYSYSIQG